MTTQPILTEEAAVANLRKFFDGKPFVVFGTGMSCAVSSQFGMDKLKDILEKKMSGLDKKQTEQWNGVVSQLNDGVSLEEALNHISDESILKKVGTITGSFIAGVDRRYAYRIATGRSQWPAIKIFAKLVNALNQNDPRLHVLTPNYDMLCEYACDAEGILYTNGFFGGVERKQDWNAADPSLIEPGDVVHSKARRTIFRKKKHICLYKVHGSLNYFLHKDNLIENNAWMWNAPDFAERVIITPGVSKYKRLQHYRQEFLGLADAAIDKSRRFLFLGYGFNDSHLEEYIKRKLINDNCYGLIITRDINKNIERLLCRSDNLWIVCRKEAGGGSRIYNNKYLGWLNLPKKTIWNVDDFSNHILGD